MSEEDETLQEAMERMSREQTGPECGRDGCTEKLHPQWGCPKHD